MQTAALLKARDDTVSIKKQLRNFSSGVASHAPENDGLPEGTCNVSAAPGTSPC